MNDKAGLIRKKIFEFFFISLPCRERSTFLTYRVCDFAGRFHSPAPNARIKKKLAKGTAVNMRASEASELYRGENGEAVFVRERSERLL